MHMENARCRNCTVQTQDLVNESNETVLGSHNKVLCMQIIQIAMVLRLFTSHLSAMVPTALPFGLLHIRIYFLSFCRTVWVSA